MRPPKDEVKGDSWGKWKLQQVTLRRWWLKKDLQMGRKLNVHPLVLGMLKGTIIQEKLWQFFKMFNIELPCDQAIPS
jgi:hypothetical protein